MSIIRGIFHIQACNPFSGSTNVIKLDMGSFRDIRLLVLPGKRRSGSGPGR